jgi:pimeloyl-ACP methyl ester carboxylesterase
MPELTTDQVSIYYEVHGTGPPILFAHESTGDLSDWASQVEHFRDRYSCILYNARGYPPSGSPRDSKSYAQPIFVLDMLAVLDHLCIETAAIVGLSMGSMTALHFGLAYPRRTHSLVLAGTGPGHSREATEKFNAAVQALADHIEERGWPAVLTDYEATPDRRELRWKNPAMHKAYSDRLHARDRFLSAMVLRRVICRRPVLAEISHQLATMDVPVLIVTGDQDDDCLPTSYFLRRMVPRSGLAVLPRTGHAVNLEEPDLFNRLLDRFYIAIAGGKW